MRIGKRSGPAASLVFLAGLFLPGGPERPGGSERPGDGGAAGSLAGRVTFDGGSAPAGVLAADAVIYLVGDGLIEATAAQATDAPPLLDQKDLTFVPHVLPVVAGESVEVRNSDAIMHNVNTNGRKNRPFNKAQLAGMTFTAKFLVPEIVPVKCDVHSQMSAYVVVVPNRFYARPAKDGTYTIANVPAGTYELVGWHERYGTVTTEVQVLEGETITAAVNFTSGS